MDAIKPKAALHTSSSAIRSYSSFQVLVTVAFDIFSIIKLSNAFPSTLIYNAYIPLNLYIVVYNVSLSVCSIYTKTKFQTMAQKHQS